MQLHWIFQLFNPSRGWTIDLFTLTYAVDKDVNSQTAAGQKGRAMAGRVASWNSVFCGLLLGAGILSGSTQILALSQPAFVLNRGQWQAPARARLDLPGVTMWITSWGFALDYFQEVPVSTAAGAQGSNRDGVSDPAAPDPERAIVDYVRHGQVIYFRFLTEEGVPVEFSVKGEEQVPGYLNFLHGNNPERWVVRVPRFRRVVAEAAGLQLVYSLRTSGELKYDLVVEPGVSLDAIRFAIEGADGWTITPDGTLQIFTRFGAVEHVLPRVWQEDQRGHREVLPARFVQHSDGTIGFQVEGRNAAYRLVIDPLIVSTYLGGSGSEEVYRIVRDDAGYVYVCGWTTSSNFPVTPGAYDQLYVIREGFVARFMPDMRTLVFSTYLGGSDDDYLTALDIDKDGNVYVVGFTESSNFPVVNAYDNTFNGGWRDVVVAKLGADGTFLYFSTYLGGSSYDYAYDVAVAQDRSVWVYGHTYSSNFPVVNQLYNYSGWYDLFLTHLDSSGQSLVFSTFIGGSSHDYASALYLDEVNGYVLLVGNTTSTNFPIVGSVYQTSNNGNYDGFVVIVDTGGNSVFRSTYIGGSSYETVRDVVVTPGAEILIVGRTTSSNYDVTPGVYDNGYNGSDDGFITKLTYNLSSLVASTYLGTNSNEGIEACYEDSNGVVTVVGWTFSSSFPVTVGAYDQSYNGSRDVVVARFTGDLSTLLYSTYFGGSGDDFPFSGAASFDETGVVWFAGRTSSSNFPLSAGAFDSLYTNNEGFIVALAACPPVEIYHAPADTVCAGEFVTLWAEDPLGMYTSLSWSHGIQDSVPFQVSGTQTYYLTATNLALGCNFQLPITIYAEPSPEVQANAYPNDTICAGSSLILYGTGTADVYEWYPPFVSDGVPFTPLASGEFVVEGINADNGCKSYDTIFIHLVEVNAGVTVSGDTLYATPLGADSYQWVMCAGGGVYAWIPGATQPYYVPQWQGNYAVIVEDQGCVDTSACIFVRLTGMASAKTGMDDIQVGTQGDRIVVVVGRGLADVQIHLYGLDGRRLHTICSGFCPAGVYSVSVIPGVYTVGVVRAEGVESVRVVVEGW